MKLSDIIRDVYDVVYASVHGMYLSQSTLLMVPGWHFLPQPLRTRLIEAINAGASRNDLLTVVSTVRREQFGKRVIPAYSKRSEAYVSLTVGFLELSRQAGVLSDNETLKRCSSLIFSYVCRIDPQPFRTLYTKCAEGKACGDRITELLRPHAALASQAVKKWGLAPTHVCD